MIFEIALPGHVIIGVIGQRKPTGDRAKPRGIRIRRRATTLNLASCFALFLGLAVVTHGQAEDRLAGAYEVNPNTAHKDVEEVLSNLRSSNLLEE